MTEYLGRLNMLPVPPKPTGVPDTGRWGQFIDKNWTPLLLQVVLEEVQLRVTEMGWPTKTLVWTCYSDFLVTHDAYNIECVDGSRFPQCL